MRIDADERSKAFPLPADVTVQPVNANGVKAEWTSTPDADPSSVILYLHGGGYVICSLQQPPASGGRGRTRRRHANPGDRLPPGAGASVSGPGARTPSPRIGILLDSGIKPNRIASPATAPAAGWSSVPCWRSARPDCRFPPAAGASRPGSTWRHWASRSLDRAESDPTVQKATILMMAQWYLGGADPRHPHASPIYGDLRGLPPLLIQVGAVETLLDDSLALARKAGIADVPVDLQIWPEMIHIWHIFFPMLVGGASRHRLGRFFRAQRSQRRLDRWIFVLMTGWRSSPGPAPDWAVSTRCCWPRAAPRWW